MIHDYQDAQYYGSLVLGTPNEEITCAMTQAHPIGGCPRIEYGSGPVSSFYSEDTVNGVGVSIANYTFTEVTKVSGLGCSYSLGNFDEICGMA